MVPFSPHAAVRRGLLSVHRRWDAHTDMAKHSIHVGVPLSFAVLTIHECTARPPTLAARGCGSPRVRNSYRGPPDQDIECFAPPDQNTVTTLTVPSEFTKMPPSGQLAQLVRAPLLHSGCRGFESLIAH